MIFFRVAVLALALIHSTSLVAGEAYKAKPLPRKAPATALTSAWKARDLAWNQATMVDAYRAHGARDPRWDAKAEAFLGDWAAWFNDNTTRDIATMVQAGSALTALGCTDPMVIYGIARGLHLSDQRADALPLYERAWTGFATHPYPSSRRAFCAARVVDCLIESVPGGPATADAATQARIEEWAARAIACQVEMLRDPAYAGMERLLLEHIGNPLGSEAIGERRQVAIEQSLAQPGVDPWLAKMWMGDRHVVLAWRARGGGWAKDVTEEGWKGFREHLDKARSSLLAAANLRRDDPCAPAELITVAMGSGTGDERKWFDRSVAAGLDHSPAYDAMRYALMPRWGGSHEAMLALGEEALATERFDSAAPWQYIETVGAIIRWDFKKEPTTVLAWPGVRENALRALDGYAEVYAKDGKAALETLVRSHAVAVAYGAGDLDDAALRRNALGARFDQRSYAWFHLDAAKAQRALDALKDVGGKPEPQF